MNDRYLFRGKRIDNREMVIGDLSIHNDENKHMIYPHNDPYMDGVDVIPESIGQCTGFKDKNGKLIFEGDILQDCDDGCYEILWNDKKLWWSVCYSKNQNIIPALSDVICSGIFYEEIIGNIHDNPELLKEV